MLKALEAELVLTPGATGMKGAIKKPTVQIVAVVPTDFPVLSGGEPSSHKIQGIGAGFVPDVLNRSIIDEIFTAHNKKAFITK